MMIIFVLLSHGLKFFEKTSFSAPSISSFKMSISVCFDFFNISLIVIDLNASFLLFVSSTWNDHFWVVLLRIFRYVFLDHIADLINLMFFCFERFFVSILKLDSSGSTEIIWALG